MRPLPSPTRCIACVITLHLIVAAPLSARQCDTAILTWAGPGPDGLLLDARNWSPPVVPDMDATLVFEDFSPLTIVLEDTDLTVARMVFRGGQVSIDLDDGDLLAGGGGVACPALEVGGPGPAQALLFWNFAGDGRFRVASAVIGTGEGQGIVRADGFISNTEFLVDSDLVVGGAADGLIRDVGFLGADSLTVGRDAPGRLTRVMSMNFPGLMIVGDRSLGEVEEGSIETGELVLGAQTGGVGDLRIDGQDSLIVEQGADIGARGVGLLRLEEGTADIGGDLRLGVFAVGQFPGYFDRGDGAVRVSGPSSLLQVGGDLAIGVLGHAELEITGPARVEVAGSVTSNPDMFELAEQRATIRINQVARDVPRLSAGGSIDLPELDVRFTPGFVPSAGDTWLLVEAGTVLTLSPNAPPTFPLLPDGLSWSVVNDGQRLTATVVGAPDEPGDLDGDGVVGLGDLLIVLANFGPCPVGGPCPGDTDGNGAVDFLDLVEVLGGWSDPAP